MNFNFFQSETIFVYQLVCFVICLCFGMRYLFSDTCDKLLQKHSWFLPSVLAIFIIWLFSIRVHFMDSFMYVWAYRTELLKTAHFDLREEWFWLLIANIFHSLRMPAEIWLAFISFCYVILTFYTCKKWLWENIMMALLFHLCSLSFLSYGVNTLRQGLACAILLLAFSLWIKNKYRIIPCVLFLLAVGTHRSSAMTIMCFLCAVYIVKNAKVALTLWLLSVVVSLAFGNYLLQYMGGMNFDERIADYAAIAKHTIYKVGFRWDFLIYGAAPILYFWYVSIKRNIVDKEYQILAITYILANAVWVQMIRMPYTDRVAYLSWFLMPLLLAYPSIRIPLWTDQDRKAGLILLAVLSFSFIMSLR